MRVIAGKYRSRRLRAPWGVATRPTSDRLRETLFNVVAQSVPGSVWLDVFAGSGAIGIEALSRGAEKVYFVESSAAALRAIRDNLKALEIEDGWQVLDRDALAALSQLEAHNAGCDFCFLDPPYRKTQDYERILSFLSDSKVLKEGSLVIAEHDKHFDPGDSFGNLVRRRTLRQGDAVLSFYSRG